ncbi:MAG: ABC transporter permease [bacterium]
MNKIKKENVAKVARWEFIKTLKSKMFLFFTFGLPLIMILFGGLGYVTEMFDETAEMKIAIIDQTDEFYSRLEEINQNSNLSFHLHEGTQKEVEKEVEEGEYEGFLFINQDNLASGQIPLMVKEKQDVNTNQLHSVINNAATVYRLAERGLTEQEITGAINPINFETTAVKEEEEKSFANIMLPIVLGMGLIFSVVISGQILMYGVIKEKKNRIVELLLSSVSSLDLMIGKIIGYGILSLVQLMIWFGAGFFLLSRFFDLGQISLSAQEVIPPLIFFVFGYIMISALFAAMGATMKEAEEGSQAQGFLVIIPMLPIFMSGMIFNAPNMLWARILSHIPPFIPGMVLLRMSATTLPLWEMVTILLALLLSIVMIIYIGARIFEKGILQYDSISLGDIKKMVFRD